ncbi:MAG: hypothetical protein PHF60_04420 [Candidatus ainarchaeum sp.]|nr:hypothetical protein [Candidatus ainarchaeum sp.]
MTNKTRIKGQDGKTEKPKLPEKGLSEGIVLDSHRGDVYLDEPAKVGSYSICYDGRSPKGNGAIISVARDGQTIVGCERFEKGVEKTIGLEGGENARMKVLSIADTVVRMDITVKGPAAAKPAEGTDAKRAWLATQLNSMSTAAAVEAYDEIAKANNPIVIVREESPGFDAPDLDFGCDAGPDSDSGADFDSGPDYISVLASFPDSDSEFDSDTDMDGGDTDSDIDADPAYEPDVRVFERTMTKGEPVTLGGCEFELEDSAVEGEVRITATMLEEAIFVERPFDVGRAESVEHDGLTITIEPLVATKSDALVKITMEF